MADRKRVAIVQARVGSSRLPGKVLLDLCGKPLIERILNRLNKCSNVDLICVATTSNEADNKLAGYIKSLGVQCFRGSENNVLERYFQAAEETAADEVIRITADDPFISPFLIDSMVESQIVKNADFTYYEGVPVGLGFGMGVISFNCLKLLVQKVTKKEDLEHVVTYIIKNKNEFTVNVMYPPEHLYYPNYRFSVDYSEDITFARALLKKLILHGKETNYELSDLISSVKDSDELRTLMDKCIEVAKK
jgi:spore coat polysaccharide biosynthesis protein SpsF